MAELSIQKVTITGANQWTDPLDIEDRLYTISIGGLSAGVGVVSLQRKRVKDVVWRDDDSFTSDLERNGEVVGKWQYRIGVKSGDYTSGTFLVEIGK